MNGGRCNLNGSCVCTDTCFVGDFCEINYNAARLPLAGAIVQDYPSTRDDYIAIFVLLSLVGLINNIFSLTTFVRERIRITVWGIYLIVFSLLSIALMLTILSYIMVIVRYDNDTYRLLACHGIPFVSLIMIDGSIFCTAAIAVERVLIECWNFSINGSRWRALCISIGIIIYACVSNLDDIFIREITFDPVGNPVCTYNFDGHPFWRPFDIVFSYAHVIIPCVIHLICSICVLTTIARRKIFICSTEDKLYQVWFRQLFIHKDFLIPPVCLILCVLPHGILGHLLQTCIPYSDKAKLRLHIAFVLLLYIPQTLTFLLYIYPNDIYWKEFQQTFIYRSMCWYCIRRKRKLREDSELRSLVHTSTSSKSTLSVEQNSSLRN
ncbi:unnamed protein product [Adineta ricciae]|uniref:G-protein coupled receptors family 1 profile domain-containing protein n=1 Tax=Adineta ricciae TaxID=249248 RepID=A0A815K527_ADIRI|nr:unnamed protein product [Adineta ricciae]CAF1390985.1 unnamed protein product [Adineta ricciae]